MSWRASARFVTGSFFSMQRASIPRLPSLCVRMSSICLSWNSAGAFMLTVNSFSLSVNVAPVSLKSKRCVSSRFAWSTALVSSWLSSSETASNEGMVGFRRSAAQGLLEFRDHVGSHLFPQEVHDHGHETFGIVGAEAELAEAPDDGADQRGVAADRTREAT